MELILGGTAYDITHRTLIMGILNRTPDSFYDSGRYWDFGDFLERAEKLVNEGADILDVGGVKAGPDSEVSEAEEMDRVVSAIEKLCQRFDLPVSVDTWRASVAKEAFAAGAVMGNDISGFGDPDYLRVASEAGAAVVACHIRTRPRVADPNPVYKNLLEDVKSFLAERAGWAEAAGIPKGAIVLDLGLDLGKTKDMSAELLRSHGFFADMGYPLLLSASNKGFLGHITGKDINSRAQASLAAGVLSMADGCRILRVHDVGPHKEAALLMEEIFDFQRSQRQV